MGTVIVKKEDGIATIVLNRPEKLNAITELSAAECLQALEEAAAAFLEKRKPVFTGE